ncbi:AI-2E family transporter [Salipaludibacillus aurantiacus]|uniref:Predicted PurR-regulated permease PerM n=1 Tax=Salipaludibacillus aurantiacus TaxID=1601833 RepID=A0A1H9XA86_9BACI|nr:AI-2E family transporter [Salipaludibacillus aurantiacus]SES43090.1 Predicted PurR-regulated permease PerM [Salipaludibacillus aurantiacus]
MPKSKWFLFLYSVVLILIAVNLANQVPFIFHPISVAFSTLTPILIVAGVLFYIIRPLVRLMEKVMPHTLSIAVIFLLFAGIAATLITFVGPILVAQINQFVENIPGFVDEMEGWLNDLMETEWVNRLQNEEALQNFEPSAIADNFSNILANMGGNILSFFGMLFSLATLLVVLPFVLFFLLKDGNKLPGNITRFLPEEQTQEGNKIMKDMDETLSAYIQGQAIVSVFVGILSLIAYLIIGLDYALILALIAMFTNLIPFIGPFIGTIPAVFVAFFTDPMMAVWVIIAIIIIQQIESNLISPNVMGHKLNIHPLTIILLLILAGNLAGLVGLILAIPFYAVTKAIVKNVYRLLRLRYPSLK